jgi:3-oxoacyl-[acyl-carrier protein] reductase
MDLHLEGSAFLVTGGSKGLGFAAAQALVDEGARVTVTGRDVSALDTAVARLGTHARFVVADNADPDAAARVCSAALSEHGRLDGALISVGGPQASTVLGTTDADWRDAFETLFLGAIRIARECIHAFDGEGAIGFVLSTSIKSPLTELALSNAMRPALAMTVKSLADEVGPRGIRVLGLVPGRVATDRLQELIQSTNEPQQATTAIPLRRDGTPVEFGRVAAFMLSPAASYVTGSMITIDGGASRAL